ncbi:Ankyrin-repeat protein [Orpheovirus IHUMI-LCC2]|uniref:Ankyrin-repeat protein n=1 Tax=Orpheovirus IHUMI-LCC2 TaxID=2023057 RepID=A0A2I2L4C4_9VIRU|nr:Ankyrin-repeat protein [Orpheovirus IHUMI-LCC2]SNW62383.1 Ankyrin-repeat protein [Orpheovirus IHUMI-LCC2]
MNIITEDVFEYIINKFLTKTERNVLRLINKKYNNRYHKIISLITLIRNGNNKTFQYIIPSSISPYIIYTALKYNNEEIIELYWPIVTSPSYKYIIKPELLYAYAIKGGNIERIKWLVNIGIDIITYYQQIMNVAVKRGNLNIIKYIYEVSKEKTPIYWIFPHASLSGNLEVMKWMSAVGCELADNNVFVNAVKYGNLENIKWLISVGCPYDYSSSMEYACEFGHIHIIEWFLENNDKNIDIKTINNMFGHAISNARIDLIKYLLILFPDADIKIHSFNFGRFAAKDRFINIGWIKENMDWINKLDFKLGKNVFNNVVANGNIDDLKWLISNGCQYGTSSLMKAIRNDHMHIVRWLYEKLKNEIGDKQINLFRESIKVGNLEMMELLYREDFLGDEWCFMDAPISNSVRVLQWIHEKNFIWNVDLFLDVYSFNDGNELSIHCSRPIFSWLKEYNLLNV